MKQSERVMKEYPKLLPVLEEVSGRQSKTGLPVILAVDGRAASGKTTIAEFLSELTGAGIIHMDDFFLPPYLRTKERLSEEGGNVDYERFAEEVLPHLRREEGFSYRRFDCSRMCFGGIREVQRLLKECPLRIVEGAYSCHPFFGEYADIRIFCDIAGGEQLLRIRQRNGQEMLEQFKNRWIPMEERYFAAFSIREQADFIL